MVGIVGVAGLCMEDLVTVLSGTAVLKSNKPVEQVYDIDEFLRKTKNRKPPIVGVWYEGVFPRADSTGAGLAHEVTASIFIISTGAKFVSVVNDKTNVLNVLDQMRDSLRVRVSPTGHKWRFISETPQEISKDVIAYVQRWSTNAVL